jgi:hypothetical protein
VWAVRISAVLALLLLGAYSVLRAMATDCVGTQCDAYILPSIALPLATILAVALTGGLAIAHARPRGGAWLAILIATTAAGVLGPPVALAFFRDRPDSLVLAATVLLAQAPVAALVYTVNETPGTPHRNR